MVIALTDETALELGREVLRCLGKCESFENMPNSEVLLALGAACFLIGAGELEKETEEC